MSEAAVVHTGPIASARRRGPLPILLGFVTFPVLVIDQATKFYVSSHMELFESIPIVPNWLDITYTRNAGAAFSMFATLPGWLRSGFLISLSLTAIAVLVFLIARAERIGPTTVAFALILAGAAGNLIDRSLHGQVIDFIRVHYYDWNYPIFNVADSAISIGVVILLAGTLREEKGGGH